MKRRIYVWTPLFIIGSIFCCISCNSTKDSKVSSNEKSLSLEMQQVLKQVFQANDTLCYRSMKTAGVEDYKGQKLNGFFTKDIGRNVVFACHCHLKYASGHLYNVPLLERIFESRRTDFQNDELPELFWFITDYVCPVGNYQSIDVIREFIKIDACESECSRNFSNDHMDMSFGYQLYTSCIGPYLIELELNELYDKVQNLSDVPHREELDESACSYTKYRAKQLYELLCIEETEKAWSTKRNANEITSLREGWPVARMVHYDMNGKVTSLVIF